jgi:hypothetical protein
MAHGFRNFTNYRLRILLAADVPGPTASGPTMRKYRRACMEASK